MPQLNPSPWFTTLMFTWFIFAVIIPPKIMSHTFPNEPSAQTAKTSKTNHSPWQWHWASLINL